MSEKLIYHSWLLKCLLISVLNYVFLQKIFSTCACMHDLENLELNIYLVFSYIRLIKFTSYTEIFYVRSWFMYFSLNQSLIILVKKTIVIIQCKYNYYILMQFFNDFYFVFFYLCIFHSIFHIITYTHEKDTHVNQLFSS